MYLLISFNFSIGRYDFQCELFSKFKKFSDALGIFGLYIFLLIFNRIALCSEHVLQDIDSLVFSEICFVVS